MLDGMIYVRWHGKRGTKIIMVKPTRKNHTESSKSSPKGFDDYELTLGDIMRGERATLGKSLLDVQRELKIKAAYISAIENCDSDVFDTPGFIAGYVRSYAKYLGMPPEEVYQKFCDESGYRKAHGMSEEASVRSSKGVNLVSKKTSSHQEDLPFVNSVTAFLPPEQNFFEKIEARAIGSIAILLTLITGIGYGGWSVLKEIQQVNFTPSDATPFALAELDPLVKIQEQIPTDQQFNQKDEILYDRLYRPEVLDIPILMPREGPISSLDPALNGNFATSSVPTIKNLHNQFSEVSLFQKENKIFKKSTQKIPQVLEKVPPQIALFATREAWVSIKSANGTRIFEKIMRPGEEFLLPMTETPPNLHAGMSGSIYFAINGELYGPAGKGAGVVKNVILSEHALKDNYKLAIFDEDPQLSIFASTTDVSTFTIIETSD